MILSVKYLVCCLRSCWKYLEVMAHTVFVTLGFWHVKALVLEAR